MEEIHCKRKPFQDDSGEGSSSEFAVPDFNYILNMNLWSLSREKKEALLAEREYFNKNFYVVVRFLWCVIIFLFVKRRTCLSFEKVIR